MSDEKADPTFAIAVMRTQAMILRRALIGMQLESTGQAYEEPEALMSAADSLVAFAELHADKPESPKLNLQLVH